MPKPATKAAARRRERRQKPSLLAAVLTCRALCRVAGEQAFDRGGADFTGGPVHALDEHEGTLAATVRGTRDYRVKLRAERGDLAYACTCPVGAAGVFCKHGVAAGLAWLAQQEAAGRTASTTRSCFQPSPWS